MNRLITTCRSGAAAHAPLPVLVPVVLVVLIIITGMVMPEASAG